MPGRYWACFFLLLCGVSFGSAAPVIQCTIAVGYGEAHLFTVAHGTFSWAVLIDAGPAEAGPRLQAALTRAGVRALDWVVVSHPHPNHYEGLAGLEPDIA